MRTSRVFLSLLLVLALVVGMVPAVAETALTDGTYTGTGKGMHSNIAVTVTVEGGAITSVTVDSQDETPGVSDPAIEQIPAAIVEAGSTDVDAVAGATLTSNGIIEAVNNALNGVTEETVTELTIEPTYTISVTHKTMDESETANAILQSASDQISEGTALYLDGELTAVCSDGDTLRSYLESLLAPYEDQTDENISVGFNKNVTLEDGIYFNDSFEDDNSIENMLTGVQQQEKIYTVKAGDTLYSIAKAYEVSEAAIKECNPSSADGLKIDQTIKIPVPEKVQAEARAEKKRKREYLNHKIKAGETLYGIARDYNISVATLMEDNPDVNPQTLIIGQTLWVRKAEIGSSSEQEAKADMAEYADNLNKATDDGYIYHVVMPGETIYSLARRFGITENEFVAMNDVDGGLKSGAVVRVPDPDHNIKQVAELAEADAAKEQAQPAGGRHAGNVSFRAIPLSETLEVALMLPLEVSSRPNASYVEFYQGFLLGLEELKEQGRGAVNLTLYNTAHDQLKVQQIVGSESFASTDLIVGPVYEDELKPVVDFAEATGVPVVSPLANLSAVESPTLFQLAPAAENKYD